MLFSPDGIILATAVRDYVYLWDMVSGDKLATFSKWVLKGSLEFSPEGKFLFSIGGGIAIWDIPNRTEVTTFTGHDYLSTIEVSPNRKIVTGGSGGWDNTVRLWNTATKDSITDLRGHSDDINSLKFSPDGELLASAGLDGTVLLWDVPYLIRDHIATDVQLSRDFPYSTMLMPNYPNPFNSHTEIVYRLATPGPVRLSIYNILGQAVRTLVSGHQVPGQYKIPWDARNDRGHAVGAGIYMARMEYAGGTQTRRLLHLK